MTRAESERQVPIADDRSEAAGVGVWSYLGQRMRLDLLGTCLGFGVLFGAGAWLVPRRGWSSGQTAFLLIVSVFALTHLLASCFHHVPRGAESGLVRLSLAAFCRTFVPLLAMFSIHNYIFPLLNEANAGSIVAAYLVSLALTLAAAFRSPN